MSIEIVPCEICGVVPGVGKSYSSRIISHTCRNYSSGWGSKLKVVADWNAANSQEIKVVKNITSTNSESESLLCVGCYNRKVGCEAGLNSEKCDYVKSEIWKK